MRNWYKKLGYILAISILANVVFSGCLNPFAPALEDPDDPLQRIKAPTTPEILLDNVKISIEQTDLDLYLDCLHENFEFEYWDDSLDHYNSWSYAVEKDRMASMFDYFEIMRFDAWNVVRSYENSSVQIRKVWFDMSALDFETGSEQLVTGYAYFEIARKKNSSQYAITLWKDESEI